MKSEADGQPEETARLVVVPEQKLQVERSELKAQNDYLWNTHKYKNDYIRFADTKAAFTVAFCCTLVAGLYKAGVHESVLNRPPIAWGGSTWAAVVAFLCLFVAIVAGVWTIRPRLSSSQSKGFIYWGAIAEHGSAEEFWSVLKTKTPEQLTAHLAHHVFALSKLAQQKYLWVAISMTSAATGSVLALFGVLFK